MQLHLHCPHKKTKKDMDAIGNMDEQKTYCKLDIVEKNNFVITWCWRRETQIN